MSLKFVTDDKSEVEPLPANSSVSDSRFENNLTGVSWIFLIVGILLGIICIWQSGVVTKNSTTATWGEHGFSWYLIVFGIISILQGLFLSLLLGGIAEIIRLLRLKK
jgi:uncharacterized integral membrane protein